MMLLATDNDEVLSLTFRNVEERVVRLRLKAENV